VFRRALPLPKRPAQTFFLWGPRQAGKTSLLRATYPEAHRIDLLETDSFAKYASAPHRLREELRARTDHPFTIIDEVQKVPALLDEVHWLIENRGLVFGLCGSSARKVRRGHANLLGGRAVRFELFGLVSHELGDRFDIERALNHGLLPRHYLSEEPASLLRAYVGDYLKEEVAAEGLVRRLPAFSEFLRVAAIGDTEPLNFSNVARECAVSSPTVRGYYDILIDTLLGRFLPAFTHRPKRRVLKPPKFYFADVGVVNTLARRGRLEAGSELYGKALESWVFHELSAHRVYTEAHYDLAYWRLASGIEVDFVLGRGAVAIEVKATRRVASQHLKGLREFAVDHPGVRRRVVVCLEDVPRRTDTGIDILPVTEFARRLWSGKLVGDES
jgi:predicted AAA+ superfamily ATPase